MKTTFVVLLGATLLAIPGAAAAESAAPACLVPASGALAELLGVKPFPWEGPVNMAATAPVACPEFRPCGSGCMGSGPCVPTTNTGSRCCFDSTLMEHCCPAGKTVWAVVCPCAGTSCTPATMQTNQCL